MIFNLDEKKKLNYKCCNSSEGGPVGPPLMEHQKGVVSDLEEGARYVMARPRTGKTRPVLCFMRDFARVLILTKKAAVGGWLSEMEALEIEGVALGRDEL